MHIHVCVRVVDCNVTLAVYGTVAYCRRSLKAGLISLHFSRLQAVQSTCLLVENHVTYMYVHMGSFSRHVGGVRRLERE